MVSDYAPGVDAETSFKEQFTKAGGAGHRGDPLPAAPIPTSRRSCSAPATPSPTRSSCSCPPARARTFVKQFVERGLDKAGIKIIGPGDVTDDDLVQRHGRSGDRHRDRALLLRRAPVAE